MSASRGSRFHSRDSVILSAIPVFPYGLESVLLARSHQRGFWRATGYRAQVPGAPAPPTSTCMFMPGSSSGVESRRALLALLVPCLRYHIAFWTVRLRRREPSTFLGNDSSVFSHKSRFSQICVDFIQVFLRCVGVGMDIRLTRVRMVGPSAHTVPGGIAVDTRTSISGRHEIRRACSR